MAPHQTHSACHSSGKATVDLIVGGTGHGYARASTADVVLLIDAEAELRRLRRQPGWMIVPLGENDTAQTLAARLPDDPLAAEVLRDYQNKPNVAVGTGSAQDGRLGTLLVRDLIASGKFEPIAESVLTALLVATNGRLAEITVREINSNSGGQGSGGAPEAGGFLAAFLEEKSSALIHQHFVRAGALTFRTVAPRASVNCAVATTRDVERLCESRPQRRVRDLEIMELPIRSERGQVIGANRELRDQLAAPAFAALLCPETRQVIDAAEVNHKNRSHLGEVRRVVVKWSAFIPEAEIVRAASRHYGRSLDETSRISGDATPIGPIGASVTIDGLPGEDQLLREIRERPDLRGPLACAALDGAPAAGSARLTLPAPFDEMSESSVLEHIESSRAARSDVDRLRAALTAFARDHEAEAARQAAVGTARREYLGRLAAPRRSESWRSRIAEALKSGRDRARDAAALREAVRDALDAHRRHGEAALVATEARRMLERLSAAARAPLAPVAQVVRRLAGEPDPREPVATFAPLENVSESLLAAVAMGDADAVNLELLRSTHAVTLNGLARMLATTPDVPSVAASLVRGDFEWISPQWGGATTLAQPRHRLVLLPPVDPGLRAALQSAVLARGADLQLVARDSVLGGCAIVALDFYAVDTADDVSPPYHRLPAVSA